MEKVERVLRCYRCGAVLQSEDPKIEGYCDAKVMAKGPNKIIYCNKCYDTMISLNTSAIDLQGDEDILKILDDAVASDALVLWVIDLFAFNGVLNADIAKKLRKNKVTVLANKYDLIASKASKKKLEEYLTERFETYGIKPYGIKFFGNTEKIDMPALIKELQHVRKGHDVYMIGKAASGKTTIINKMLKFYNNKTNRAIRSFFYEGADNAGRVLEIPLDKSSFLYELPGISNNNSLVNKVEKEVQKILMPKKGVKVSARLLMPNEYLSIGNLGAFSLVSGKPTQFKFYSAEGVETKKVHASKLQAFVTENYIKKDVRPVSERFTKFMDFDVFDYYMEKDGLLHDICIEGLGWISFKANGQVIRVTAPKGAALSECLSKIR